MGQRMPIKQEILSILYATKCRTMHIYDYRYTTHYLEIRQGLKLAYYDEGEGPETLLFLHGLGSYIRGYEKLIGLLRSEYRCIAIDLPNYGKSSQGDYPINMAWFVKVIDQFVQKLGIQRFSLGGHSMGGQIAIHYALRHPERLRQLLLFSPAGFETFSILEQHYFKGIYNPLILKSLSTEQIRTNFHLNFHEFPEDAQFMIDDRLLLRKTPAYDHFCKMIPQCVFAMLDAPVFDRLPELQMPTLVLYGLSDQLIPNSILHPKLETKTVAYQGFKQLKKGQ
ncbi:MAG: alpha/beta hydrolase, partial [Phaeodactylibacter sp.]|nr:alpha/beta hydrolase [Phaeodactylibacter sp.]